MSHQAQSWAVGQIVGDALAKAVLMNLANRADETGHCYPGQERISADTEIKLRTVKRKLAQLCELGLVSIFRRMRGRERLSNGYQLDMPKVEGAGAAPSGVRKVPETVLEGAGAAPSYKDEPPEEPSDIYTSEFGKFWEEYPVAGRQHASRVAVHGEWSKLDDEGRDAALAGLKGFRAYCDENDWYHPKSPLGYLRNRMFDSYQPAKVNGVLIGRGSSEWEAWWPHFTPFTQKYLTKNETEFWRVPTPWPPGHQPPAELDKCA